MHYAKQCGMSTLLFVLNWIWASAEPLSYFSGIYGDELRQAIRYFTVKTPKYNETDYFQDYNSCDNDKRPRLCTKLINKWYREGSKIWKQPPHSKLSLDLFDGRPTDCRYSLGNASITETSSNDWDAFIEVKFLIAQSDCNSFKGSSGSVIPFGGATFDVFASSSSAQASCKYFDLENNLYDVSCLLPTFGDISSYCINITVLLIYEHFDGYSESLQEWSSSYLPLRRIVADNDVICTKANKILERAVVKHHERLIEFDANASFRWIGGFWKSPTSSSTSSQSLFNILQNQMETAWQHRLKLNLTNDYHKFPHFKRNNATIPSLAADLSHSLLKAAGYTFHAFEAFHPSTRRKETKKKWLHVLTPDRFRPFDRHEEMKYVFLGASHMRYNFDFLIEYYFGESRLAHLNRKHDHLIVSNFRFDFVGNARDLSDFLLRNVCSHHFLTGFANASSNSRPDFTVILQTGAWDLSVAPLRQLIHNPSFGGGHRLSTTLSGILRSPQTSCAGLRHVVWMTAVPYPECFNAKEPNCGAHRNYRTNSAIAAANQFFLKSLLGLDGQHQHQHQHRAERFPKDVALTIVDAFSIIKPRLVFNEDSEVLCLSHYLCRMHRWANIGKEAGDGNVIMVQTPAGTAVVQSLMHALHWL